MKYKALITISYRIAGYYANNLTGFRESLETRMQNTFHQRENIDRLPLTSWNFLINQNNEFGTNRIHYIFKFKHSAEGEKAAVSAPAEPDREQAAPAVDRNLRSYLWQK